MPYYKAGDYYQGDYYQAGGLFSGLGKLVKKVAGTALSVIPGGGIVKAGLKIGSALIGPGARPRALSFEDVGGTDVMIPAFRGGRMRLGGSRRMNVTNVKALRRAGRRVRGFLKIARRLGALPVGTSSKGKLFKKKRRG